ncbi:choline/ethanolamine kinase family protein [Mycobacterium sp. MS1601]|uniref:choline/ethanolamine kinase family protein n=1 Tax=Mycobacterium sp. MS1601 TaxID=1936029 RepID=UPI001F3A98A7|nr:choline/ethanolamine kinase family protein [Mycobacterium sp. MS1601]
MTVTDERPDSAGDRTMGSARSAVERRVEDVLSQIERWQGRTLTYAPVLGGLMNSNWRITVEGLDTRYFLKIPGDGSDAFIDRTLANEATRRAGERGIGAEVVHFDSTTGVEVIEFLEGYRACTNGDFKRPEVPVEIIGIYRNLHDGGLLSGTKTMFDMIEEHLDQAREIGVNLPVDADLILGSTSRPRRHCWPADSTLLPATMIRCPVTSWWPTANPCGWWTTNSPPTTNAPTSWRC